MRPDTTEHTGGQSCSRLRAASRATAASLRARPPGSTGRDCRAPGAPATRRPFATATPPAPAAARASPAGRGAAPPPRAPAPGGGVELAGAARKQQRRQRSPDRPDRCRSDARPAEPRRGRRAAGGSAPVARPASADRAGRGCSGPRCRPRGASGSRRDGRAAAAVPGPAASATASCGEVGASGSVIASSSAVRGATSPRQIDSTEALPYTAAPGFCRGVAQPGSAPALGAGGPQFKSGRPDTPSNRFPPAPTLRPELPVAQLDRAAAF